MGLGDKGARQAGRGALFKKTESGASARRDDASDKKVRKQIEISGDLEERLKYHCYINGINIEASVIRDALDQYLPQVPKEMKRK